MEECRLSGAIAAASNLECIHEIIKYKDQSMDYEIKSVTVDDEFKVCPSCGYRDGFHSMFRKQDNITKWLFICPSCHVVFDIGYTA